jgi:hypothetical protein
MIYALITSIFGEKDRKFIIDMYTAMRDKCSTMYEFRGLIAKKFGPIILMQVMEDFGMNTQLFKNYIADIQMNRETRNLSEALSGIK